jgi:prepilin-type N-terminal cleavage/methylation domain-containing protein
VQFGKRAFTLIELLVVIGIIGVLAGGIGLMLKGNNPGSALRAAQSTLMGTLAAARGQAALNQTNAMIIVQSDPSVDNFLRSVRVVVEITAGSGTWKEVGGEVIMPQGVFIVPNSTSLTSTTLSSTASKRLSDFFTTSGSVTGLTINGAATSTSFLQSKIFTPLGSINSPTGGRVLVAAGNPTGATAFTLDNSAAVRGFVVSKYGVATLINDSETLDN